MTTRSSTVRSVLLVVGALAVLLGIGLGIGGAVLVWAHSTQRDTDGFYSTSAEGLETSTFALRSDEIDLGLEAGSHRWVPGDGPSAVRIRVTSGAEQPVFVGIGATGDVDRYLARSAHAELTDFKVDPFRPELRETNGETPPATPGGESFWSASATGAGTQTLTWPAQSGTWTVVVMNADASPGVAVDVAVGAKTGVLLPIGLGLGGLALLFIAGGVACIVTGSRRGGPRSDLSREPAVPDAPVPPQTAPAGSSS